MRKPTEKTKAAAKLTLAGQLPDAVGSWTAKESIGRSIQLRRQTPIDTTMITVQVV